MRRPHWAFKGFQRRARADVSLILRDPDMGYAHVGSLRRVVRVGPWGLYLMRYRPGPLPSAPSEGAP